MGCRWTRSRPRRKQTSRSPSDNKRPREERHEVVGSDECLFRQGDPMPLIRSKDVELFYDLTGPEGAPAVAFSNSIGTTLEMWDRQVPALSDRYRCLRYDTRGHGRSLVVDRPVKIEDLADDLAGLLDALGIDKAHIVGLS